MFFADENLIGLGKLLCADGRDDVIYPGHPRARGVLLGMLDTEWMPLAGRHGWIVLSRDRRTRTRPAELELYYEHGLRSVWLGAKRDLGPPDQYELFRNHEVRLGREITKRGRGPWALSMTPTGIKPVNLRPHPGLG